MFYLLPLKTEKQMYFNNLTQLELGVTQHICCSNQPGFSLQIC